MVVWIPRIPLWKGLLCRGTPIRIPNHQPNSRFELQKTKTQETRHGLLLHAFPPNANCSGLAKDPRCRSTTPPKTKQMLKEVVRKHQKLPHKKKHKMMIRYNGFSFKITQKPSIIIPDMFLSRIHGFHPKTFRPRCICHAQSPGFAGEAVASVLQRNSASHAPHHLL